MNNALLIRNPRAARVRGSTPLAVETIELNESFSVDTCAGRDLVIVEGGDGTLQRILTTLLAFGSSDALPPLAVLPAGTTNMNCAEFNRSRDYDNAVASLRQILAGGAFDIRHKSVVRVDEGARTLFGFCFCLGAVVDAVRQFASARTRRPLFDSLAIAGVFAKALLRTHTALRIHLEAEAIDTFAMVATTLDRLLYGMTPFQPGRRATGLHTTWIEGNAPGLWRKLPSFFRGDPALFATDGFRSFDVERLQLRFDGPFVIDGEMFANPEGGVCVSMSPPVRFIVI